MGDDQGEKQLYVSRDRAYDGIYSMAFDADLKEREDNSDGNTVCLTLNGSHNSKNYSLQNQIVISRLYVPEGVPDNLGVQYHLTGQDFYPSWATDIVPGQWNTFAWYTADAPDWVEGSDLQFCLYLEDANHEPENEYHGVFYMDAVALVPYQYTYERDLTLNATNALEAVNLYGFETPRQAGLNR